MRFDLDAKLQAIRLDKLIQVLGKGLAEKVRFYSKKYRKKFDKSYNSSDRNINFDLLNETIEDNDIKRDMTPAAAS